MRRTNHTARKPSPADLAERQVPAHMRPSDPRFRAVFDTVRASELSPFSMPADGAVITRVHFGRNRVNLTVVHDGKLKRRRYRHDQPVRIVTWVPREDGPRCAG